MLHNEPGGRWWSSLYDRFPAFQLALLDADELVAEGHSLIGIERYMLWRREDGSHLDPWLRVHERAGGEIVAPAPGSMVMEVPAADWEEWTGMQFPEDDTYVFPGALAPLEVRDGIGRHVEPNVWVRHRV